MRRSQHFFERGQSPLRLVQSVVKHGTEPALARELLKSRHINAVDDGRMKRRIDTQELDDADSAPITRSLTLRAAGSLPKGRRQVGRKSAPECREFRAGIGHRRP